MFGDEKIILLGHSLGGFLACTYALEQPDSLKYVILAAPVGIAPFIISPQKGWFRKSIQHLIWNCGMTPQSILRSFGYFSRRVWDKLGDISQFRGLDKDGWDYLYHAQMGPPSGDRAFMSILTKEGWAYPLFDKLGGMKVPTRIIYGERDYINPSFAPNAMAKLPNADYKIINNAGHHMYWSHTKEFNLAIINLK